MTDVKLKIAPPWVTYVNELQALFGNDPDIKVEYNNDDRMVTLYVGGDSKKAEAIDMLLPLQKEYGAETLYIEVVPANEDTDYLEDANITSKELFDIAFERNPVYAFSQKIDGIFTNVLTYVVFKNRVVQFFNDNLNDIYGNVSTLYQEIASDVFEDSDLNGVFFCTDVEEKVGMPLGEWP